MRSIVCLLIVIFVAGNASVAHDSSSIRRAKLEAMQKLRPLVGNWSGSGSYFGPTGKEEVQFVQRHSVQEKVDSLILVLDGSRRALRGPRLEETFAIVSFDPQSREYRIISYDDYGRMTQTAITLTTDGFQWETESGWRYTVAMKNGEWHQTVKRSVSGDWKPFVEFRLKKLNP